MPMSLVLLLRVLFGLVLFVVCFWSAAAAGSHRHAERLQKMAQAARQQEALESQRQHLLVQERLELQLHSMITDLNRLGQVIRGSEKHDAPVPDAFSTLEALRFAQDRITLMLYSMALDHRVKPQEVALIGGENQRLWGQYHQILAKQRIILVAD